MARHYAVAMHKRFGRFALETFWVHGVVGEAICDALRSTAQARTAAHQEAVRADPGYVAAQKRAVAKATQARKESRAAANLAARLEAATESPGYCDECWWWASPHRAVCQRCSKALCHWCQFQEHGVFYLLCGNCATEHGTGPVYPPGRVIWQPRPPAPAQCHFLLEPLARFGAEPPEGEQHAPGELLQCTRCNRWICAWCARDDGPPTYCARCPLLMLQGGRFPGMSLVDPLRSKGTGKGKSPLACKGPITRQVAEDLHRYADEQSRAAVGQAFATSQGTQDSKGRGAACIRRCGATSAASEQRGTRRRRCSKALCEE